MSLSLPSLLLPAALVLASLRAVQPAYSLTPDFPHFGKNPSRQVQLTSRLDGKGHFSISGSPPLLIPTITRNKRDVSVMPDCGPLSGRCRLIPRGTCVRICINNVRRWVCRTNADTDSCRVYRRPS